MVEIMLVLFFFMLVGFVILLNYRNNLVYNVMNKRIDVIAQAGEDRIDEIFDSRSSPVIPEVWAEYDEWSADTWTEFNNTSYRKALLDLRKWKYEDFFPDNP